MKRQRRGSSSPEEAPVRVVCMGYRKVWTVWEFAGKVRCKIAECDTEEQANTYLPRPARRGKGS